MTKRCRQCWRFRPLRQFIGRRGVEVQICRGCQDRYYGHRSGERASEPRRGLPTRGGGRPIVTWNPRSQNRKLGNMPAALISAETCPPTCGFYGKGCFAEFSFLGKHWRDVEKNGLDWDAFLAGVAALPEGQPWRYAVAGDLPGQGDELDAAALGELVEANLGRRGFTFTHKPLSRAHERWAVRGAIGAGFTINLSADSLEHADARADLDAGPVAVVLPTGGGLGDIRTPAGRRVVVCPAETRGLTCAECQLCTRGDRRGIVGFVAHGQMSATVSRIATGRRLPVLNVAAGGSVR